jgi:taurine dioxygenase
MNLADATQHAANTSFRKLTGTMGAELIGARMDPDDPEIVEQVQHTAITRRVVVIRDQFLGPDELRAFGGKLGKIMMTRGVVADERYPELLKITNPGKAKALSENWHTDGTTSECPPSLSVLAAQEIPEAGGDTLFVDMGYAYQTLSAGYQRLLRGLLGRHISHFPASDERFLKASKKLEAQHPLVRTIPETGERVLFPGFPNIMNEIVGMTIAESMSILDFLFAHATRHDGMYRHRWLPGDVLVWDNRSTMHYAVHDYGDATRTLYRVMIEGERPYDAPYPDVDDLQL